MIFQTITEFDLPSWVESFQREADAAIGRLERHLDRRLTDAERASFLPEELRRRLEAIDRAIADDAPSEVVADLINRACEFDPDRDEPSDAGL